VVLVQAETVDQDGNRCPTASNMVNFSLDGPAEWRGGLAQGPDNYILAKELPVENGVNRVLFRSTTTAGKINLTAKAEGLQAATLSLETLPVKTANGLSNQLPNDGLKPNLSKGATPLDQSYTVTRKSIKIVSAEAGANSEKANLSFDDNELSDWVNDGKVTTAWIKYTLAKESTVSAVSLKLNGFRTKIYSLKILVDGKVVFEGNSKPSLGYFTANCKATKGKTVTIQLVGSGKEKENSNVGVEVNGKKLDDGVERAETKLKGGLSIIEAEVYEQP
jgi:beta-galactosidase